jgi:two-component system NtrC family sensor kinase
MQFTRRGIRVEVRRQADDDLVLASAEELKSVFLNLLLNAADAMPEGGRLRIWTHNEGAHDDRPAVWLHIADDGAGIPPELRDRIFDPFFTTKREGSGIGLSLALRTLRHHGGELSFEKSSEIEPGAEFIIRLPLLENGSGGLMIGIDTTTVLTDGEELAAIAMTDLNDGVITS